METGELVRTWAQLQRQLSDPTAVPSSIETHEARLVTDDQRTLAEHVLRFLRSNEPLAEATEEDLALALEYLGGALRHLLWVPIVPTLNRLAILDALPNMLERRCRTDDPRMRRALYWFFEELVLGPEARRPENDAIREKLFLVLQDTIRSPLEDLKWAAITGFRQLGDPAGAREVKLAELDSLLSARLREYAAEVRGELERPDA